MKKIKNFIIGRKILSAVILVVLLFGIYQTYKHYSSSAPTEKYLLTTVKKGDIVSTISGSGQVAAQNQVDILASVSGDILSVLVNPGDEVKAGQTIARVDNTDARKALDNAELALENAKVSYDKAVKSSNDQSANSSISDLKKAYESGYTAIANTLIDLPAIFLGVSNIYYTQSHSPYFTDNQISQHVGQAAIDYKSQAGVIFDSVKRDFDNNFSAYKSITAESKPEEIVALLNTSNSILKKLLLALSGTYSTIDYINNRYDATIPPEIASDKSQLNGYVSKVNADTNSVTSALTSIENAKDSNITANLNMKSAQLSVSQAEQNLTNAQSDLADHDIKAPFDGIIAKVPAKVSDKATANTNIATIITNGKIVNISLNEIDAAKVKTGDKTTLSFDAIDTLNLSGHVSNVDLVGTVSQGVVSYNVEITFDENDGRVKPGMTVNADIVSATKSDVLVVPSGAVKTTNGRSFVQVMGDNSLPMNKMVTIGTTNDTLTEVVSGLNEGDKIVAKTVTGTASTRTTTPSILNSIGGNRGAAAGGNTVRSNATTR